VKQGLRNVSFVVRYQTDQTGPAAADNLPVLSSPVYSQLCVEPWRATLAGVAHASIDVDLVEEVSLAPLPMVQV
jgi:hypothetical protein